MSDVTPETLLATVNQIHERFMGMMGRVPEGIANDLAEVQLAAAAWEADRKWLEEMQLELERIADEMDGWTPSGDHRLLGEANEQLERSMRQWAEEMRIAQVPPNA
jgi:hypothetical protein